MKSTDISIPCKIYNLRKVFDIILMKPIKAFPEEEMNESATYLICMNSLLRRLRSESDIIYIGSAEKGLYQRFANYKSKTTPTETFLMQVILTLMSEGNDFTLKVFFERPDNLASKEYEGVLLLKFLKEHWELPPLNRRLEKSKSEIGLKELTKDFKPLSKNNAKYYRNKYPMIFS